MIKLRVSGDFRKTRKFLKNIGDGHYRKGLDKYGQMGVDALAAATPVRTGKTASSWTYEVNSGRGSIEIVWTNTNINKNVNIAVIIQFGHGTRNGGYVEGIDYINPALRPVFERIADEIWTEVTKA